MFNKLLFLCGEFYNYCRTTLDGEKKRLFTGEGVDRGPEIIEGLDRMEFVFLYHVKLFIFYLNSHSDAGVPSLSCLATQLDYNNFYKRERVSRPSPPSFNALVLE